MKGKTPRNLVTCLVFHFHKVSPNTKKTFLWSLIKVIRYYHRSQGIIFLIPPSKRWLLLLKRIHFVPEVVKLGPLDFLFVNHLYLLYVRWIPIISIIWRQKTLYFCQKYWLHYKLLREVTVLKLTFIQVNTISQEASKSCFFFTFLRNTINCSIKIWSFQVLMLQIFLSWSCFVAQLLNWCFYGYWSLFQYVLLLFCASFSVSCHFDLC